MTEPPASTNRPRRRRPTAGQGCLIAIGGAALAFFTCLGGLVIHDPSSIDAAFTQSLLLMLPGTALFIYGVAWMIVRAVQAMRGRSTQDSALFRS